MHIGCHFNNVVHFMKGTIPFPPLLTPKAFICDDAKWRFVAPFRDARGETFYI